jgi:GNAT superfamily N-acetyltransferase
MDVLSVSVRRATTSDAELVAHLVVRLLQELGGFGVTTADILPLATSLLATEEYAAFLAATAAGEPVGVLTVNECTALYVAGKVGWIQELYVTPSARSAQVGHTLLQAVRDLAQARQWRRLEVNTPDANDWPRTVAFYRREGFIGASVHLRMAIAPTT